MRPKRPRRELPPRRFDRHREQPPVRVPPLLRRANHLFSSGKYQDAAKLYEKLAREGQDRNLPRTPLLFLQSSKAYLVADNLDEGMRLLMIGLEMFADQDRWSELFQFGKRSVNILNELGYSEQAEEVESWLEGRLPGKEKSEVNENGSDEQKTEPTFPVTCPFCGARVHPDEIKVVDENIVECSYCGNLIIKK